MGFIFPVLFLFSGAACVCAGTDGERGEVGNGQGTGHAKFRVARWRRDSVVLGCTKKGVRAAVLATMSAMRT